MPSEELKGLDAYLLKGPPDPPEPPEPPPADSIDLSTLTDKELEGLLYGGLFDVLEFGASDLRMLLTRIPPRDQYDTSNSQWCRALSAHSILATIMSERIISLIRCGRVQCPKCHGAGGWAESTSEWEWCPVCGGL